MEKHFFLLCPLLVVCGACPAGFRAVLVGPPPPPCWFCAVFVRAPPHGVACCVGACLPQWWCMVLSRGVWPGLSSSVGWVAVVVVLLCLAGVGAVLVSAPPLLGRAVSVRGPPLGGACGVVVFGFQFVVLYGRRCPLSVVCGVCLAGFAAVLVRARPLLRRAVFVRGPPHGGACCVGV